MRKESPRNTWYIAGQSGKAAHYHDAMGLPVCGNGWFSGGYPTKSKPMNACKNCEKRTND